MDIEKDMARIALQEERLRFPRFDAGIAWEVGSAIKEAAEARGARVVIDVSTHAQQLFFFAMPGTTPDNLEWVRRKRNVVLRFFSSSYAMGLKLQRDGATLQSKHGLGPDTHMAHGGSFPLWLAGSTCIGAITVSGLPQREDHDFLTRTLAAYLGIAEAEIALQES